MDVAGDPVASEALAGRTHGGEEKTNADINVVKRVHDYRVEDDGSYSYLVEWKEASEFSWVPVSDFYDYDCIHKFWAQQE